ncbi:MAG: cadherin-like beta sandwich domain-containing protein, partial [Verrucomicrobiota bacterium]
MAADAAGNVYVSDQANNRIRKITPAGEVTTVAGDGTSGYLDGTGTLAKVASPSLMAVDAGGNLYVESLNRIRKINPLGVVTTLAGSGTAGYLDGPGATARFSSAAGVAVDGSGNVYVGDWGNHRIRKITMVGPAPLLARSGMVGMTEQAVDLVVSDLIPGTTYYYWAEGGNVAGTNTGAVMSFVTLSTNAALSGLVANAGPLAPAFAAGTGTYWTGVSNSVTNTTITATVAQSNATLTVNGTVVASGTASGLISLVVGTSSIPVVVTAQDGTTIRSYTVMVIREAAVPAFTNLAASLIGSNVVTLSVSMTPYDLPTGSFFQYGSVTNLAGVTFSTLMDGVWNGMAPVAITNLVT